MGIYLNPSSIGFKRSLNSEIYVDKTGLIEKTNALLDTEQKFICVSRPRALISATSSVASICAATLSSSKQIALRYIIYCSIEEKSIPLSVNAEGYQLLRYPFSSSAL